MLILQQVRLQLRAMRKRRERKSRRQCVAVRRVEPIVHTPQGVDLDLPITLEVGDRLCEKQGAGSSYLTRVAD